MKKIASLTMVVVLLLVMFTFNVSAQSNVCVYLNGEKITFDVQPQIINGRTMVPMRKIFEELGASVEWVQETKTIIGKKEDTTIIMQIDNKELSVNDNVSILDVAPSIIDGRTLVPVRAIAESLGVDVLWYGDIATVAIYNDKTTIEQKILYNLKGDLVYIDTNFENNYVSLGWASDISEIETVCMYAPDGKTKYVHIGDAEDEIAVGWYTEPVVTMYAADGRTQVVKKTEVEANKLVGWYTEPVVTMYAMDGRTTTVGQSEVEAYEKVGWYKSKEEIELVSNRNKLPSLVYNKSKCGSITGVVTWQYNKYVGTKPDVGADVMLIQTNHIPTDMDNLNIGFVCGAYNDPTVHYTEVDGMGNYYLDNIPAGEYILLIKSEATNESPEIYEITQKIAENYLNGKISSEALDTLKLNIRLYSFEIKKIEIKANQTSRYSIDWGYTYY